ncbi:MAG: tRNA (N(6)-L-threonylcarbamoyladenosine(37)-C(2))-methylthiotransferase MtaB [Thermodesulfobacteriota bacterium]
MTTRVKHITLGCKVNQAESEGLAEYGRRKEVVVVGARQAADLCIINTCAVTGKAAMQSRQAIRKAIRNNPGAVIAVTGCYAQQDPETLGAIEGIDYIIGQSQKHRLYEIIDMAGAKAGAGPVVVHDAIRQQRGFHPMPAPAIGSRTRPFLKIQDGCDAFCTYCIVPHTRGRSRSLPPDRALAEVRQLIAAGAQEIVLSGIHLGCYGHDLDPPTGLLALLQQMEQIDFPVRIRLSSIEPTEFSDALVDFIAENPRICPHFHMPLQSGDPEILKRMRRPYSPEFFADRIETFKRRLPKAAIGVDVLIGFPGESETAFRNTFDFIDSLPVSYLHVFPYSPRPPAPAARYRDPVSPPEIKRRCKIIHELGDAKKAFFFKQMCGKTLDVLIEKPLDAEASAFTGLSENYIPVCIQQPGLTSNTRMPCYVTDADGDRHVTAIPAFSRTPHPGTACKPA